MYYNPPMTEQVEGREHTDPITAVEQKFAQADAILQEIVDDGEKMVRPDWIARSLRARGAIATGSKAQVLLSRAEGFEQVAAGNLDGSPD